MRQRQRKKNAKKMRDYMQARLDELIRLSPRAPYMANYGGEIVSIWQPDMPVRVYTEADEPTP